MFGKLICLIYFAALVRGQNDGGPSQCKIKCPVGQVCILVEVVCLQSPCPLMPTCVSSACPPLPSCIFGYELDSQGCKRCKRGPFCDLCFNNRQ